jgi:hypothetical protein
MFCCVYFFVDFKRALQCSSPTIAKTYFILQHKPLFYIAAKTFILFCSKNLYFILQPWLLLFLQQDASEAFLAAHHSPQACQKMQAFCVGE